MSASSKVVRAVVAVVALSGVAASSVGVAPVTHREGIANEMSRLPSCNQALELPVATQRICIEQGRKDTPSSKAWNWTIAEDLGDEPLMAKTPGTGSATVALDNKAVPCLRAWVYVVMNNSAQGTTFVLSKNRKSPDPDGRTVRIVTSHAAWSYWLDLSSGPKSTPYEFYEAGYPSKQKMLPLKTASVGLWVGYKGCGDTVDAARAQVRKLLDRIEVSDADCIDPTEFRSNGKLSTEEESVGKAFVHGLCIPRPDSKFAFKPGSWKGDIGPGSEYQRSARFVAEDGGRLGVFVSRHKDKATYAAKHSSICGGQPSGDDLASRLTVTTTCDAGEGQWWSKQGFGVDIMTFGATEPMEHEIHQMLSNDKYRESAAK